MPYDDFSKQLTQLQAQNLGAGFIMQAQVEALKNQDQATINTLAIFNQAKNNLDNELRTTEEQLQDLESSDVFKDGVEDLDALASQYEAMINASIMRQQKLADIYGSAVRDLSQIGSQESKEIAGRLSQDLPIQMGIEEQRGQKPIEKLKYMGMVNQLIIGRLDAQQRQMEVDKMRQDIEVMDSVSQVLDDPASGWQELFANLTFNKNTGKRNYIKQKEEFMENLFTNFKDNKNLGRIMLYFDNLIESQVRDYDPPVFAPSSGGLQGVYENEKKMLDTYDWLLKTSAYMEHVETSPEFSLARSSYNTTAMNLLKEKGIDPTSPEAQKYLNFGSNREVLTRMASQEKIFGDASKVILFRGEYSSPTDIATWIYHTKYDSDPENNEYYPKYYQILKDIVIPGKREDKLRPIEPIFQLSEGEVLELKNKGTLKEAENLYGRYYAPNRRIVPTTQGNIVVDFSKLTSFESNKWWNPHRVSSRMAYVETEPEKIARLERERKSKEKKKSEEKRMSLPDNIEEYGVRP